MSRKKRKKKQNTELDKVAYINLATSIITLLASIITLISNVMD